MWQIFTFVVNALLFALVELQLHHIVNALSRSAGELLRDAIIVCVTVILTRIVWVFPLSYGTWVWWARRRGRESPPTWQGAAVLSWMGLRGAVTLAAALALPLTTDAGDTFPNRDLIIFLAFAVIVATLALPLTTNAGDAFPNRDLIIFLAFAVIVATLVLQGLTLPAVIRLLGVEDDGLDEKEEAKARIHAADAATARLEELVDEDWVRPETLERMRGLMDFRRNRFSARFSPDDDGAIEERSQAYQRLMHEVLDAERAAVLQLRREGRINDDVMRRVTRDLDLEEARLDS